MKEFFDNFQGNNKKNSDDFNNIPSNEKDSININMDKCSGINKNANNK